MNNTNTDVAPVLSSPTLSTTSQPTLPTINQPITVPPPSLNTNASCNTTDASSSSPSQPGGTKQLPQVQPLHGILANQLPEMQWQSPTGSSMTTTSSSQPSGSSTGSTSNTTLPPTPVSYDASLQVPPPPWISTMTPDASVASQLVCFLMQWRFAIETNQRLNPSLSASFLTTQAPPLMSQPSLFPPNSLEYAFDVLSQVGTPISPCSGDQCTMLYRCQPPYTVANNHSLKFELMKRGPLLITFFVDRNQLQQYRGVNASSTSSTGGSSSSSSDAFQPDMNTANIVLISLIVYGWTSDDDYLLMNPFDAQWGVNGVAKAKLAGNTRIRLIAAQPRVRTNDNTPPLTAQQLIDQGSSSTSTSSPTLTSNQTDNNSNIVYQQSTLVTSPMSFLTRCLICSVSGLIALVILIGVIMCIYYKVKSTT